MTLLQETRELLKADKRTLGEIAKGAGLGREWLSKLSRGLIPDPGVNKIERLNAFLKGSTDEAAA